MSKSLTVFEWRTVEDRQLWSRNPQTSETKYPIISWDNEMQLRCWWLILAISDN